MAVEAAVAANGAPPLPRPRSPPECPDLCGRHRLEAEVRFLNSEIGFLEKELKSLEGFQSVSKCCKEVDEYVVRNSDPLIPIAKKRDKSCLVWSWIRAKLCFSLSWICCYNGCTSQLNRPSCSCKPAENSGCSCPRGCHFYSCSEASCCRTCCSLPGLSCPRCSCSTVLCSKCTEVSLCPKCNNICCTSRCLCQ